MSNDIAQNLLNKQYMNLTKLFVSILLLFCLYPATSHGSGLFGSVESKQEGLEIFPQWLSVLDRHIRENVPEGNCDSQQFNRCHLTQWLNYLETLKGQDVRSQLRSINQYANQKEYILDIDNYNLDDYWAIPKQFLSRGGDCEDYAITKLLSLRWLGQQQLESRIVVLQDANLGIPHAVLAVYLDGDTLILDNQVNEILSHRNIFHYIPIYSLDEKRWWIHLPS